MSRLRTRGSNGDSHSSILDLSSGAVLKIFVMSKAVWILLKACDIFSIFTTLDVAKNEVLTNLGSFKATIWNRGKAEFFF